MFGIGFDNFGMFGIGLCNFWLGVLLDCIKGFLMIWGGGFIFWGFIWCFWSKWGGVFFLIIICFLKWFCCMVIVVFVCIEFVSFWYNCDCMKVVVLLGCICWLEDILGGWVIFWKLGL